MKYCLFILTMVLCVPNEIYSQAPLPCGEEGQMEPFCSDACIICDIDGFSGINNSPINGVAPPDFCTQSQDNIQWIAFIAGTTNLTLEVFVGDCTGGDRELQIGIYEGINCTNFQRVSNCDNSIPQNTSELFITDVPLVIGQYYFFVMDGGNSSVCEYTISVVDGSTNVSNLVESNPIAIPDLICANQPFEISIEPQLGATIYSWRLDGMLISNAPSFETEILEAGTYDLCYTESNACDAAEPNCIPLVVSPQIIKNEVRTICEGDTVLYNGVQYSMPGTYPGLVIPAAEGCDTIANLVLEFGAIFEGDDQYFICEGDTLFLNDQQHYEEGVYDHFLLTERGCDSTVHVAIDLVICNMMGSSDVTDLLCFGDGDAGSVTFRVTSGTPPFTYSWVKVLDEAINGSGMISMQGEDVTLNNLGAGTYLISISDEFGNSFTILSAEVKEPTQIQTSFTSSDFNGYNVACFDGANGEIITDVSGGTPGYTYAWNNGTNEKDLSNLPVDTYILTVNDENNCPHFDTITLIQPQPLSLSNESLNPNCDGPNTGSITINPALGGVSEYSYNIDGGAFSSNTMFQNLSEGIYTVEVQDLNGCITTIYDTLIAAQIPVLSFLEDITINLGDSMILSPILNNIDVASSIWTPNENLSCIDCFEPYSSPLFTTSYTLTVTSIDGCMDSATIIVFVEKDRGIFAPNVFSPNASGENQMFSILGGRQIEQILELNIYDRWGSLVYNAQGLSPTTTANGWDGFINGQPAMTGVYVWTADVEYLDGEQETFAGDITLLR